ncbi:MAG: DUF3352 domain-containing protein [Phormidesmis sp.]
MIFRETALSLKRIVQPIKQNPKRYQPLAACLSLALSLATAATAATVSIAWALPSQAADEAAEADRSIAKLLPASTPLAIFISAQSQEWQALEQFELFAKIADLTGGFANVGSPAGIFFAPPGADYAADIEPWIGEKIAIATLPDTTPGSIAVTDVAAETYVVVPIANEAAIAPFIEKLEASRPEAPEKSTYLGAELWVWPERTESYDDKDGSDNWQHLPEVPHERIERPSKAQAKAQAKASVKPEAQAIAHLKATSSEGSMPLPGDFEPERDYDTYTVPGYAIAKIDGYLIFSTEPSTIKTLLDYGQFNTPRLVNSELFLRSQYGQTEGAVARVYGNLSEVTKYNLDGSVLPGVPGMPRLPGGLGGLGFPSVPTPPSPLGTSQATRALAAKALAGTTMDILLYPQSEGLRLQGRVYGNDLIRSQATPEFPYANSVLAFVPAPAYSLGSGRDIAGLWQQIAANLSINEFTSSFLEQARSVVSLATGLDLDTELLGWMDREFVLFFFPSSEGAINSFAPGTGVEIGIAIQTSDRPTAQTTLDTIDSLVGSFITTTSTTINNTSAVSWQAPSFNSGFSSDPAKSGTTISYLSHSWIAEDTVIITSGAGAMAHLLNVPDFKPVTEHSTFLNATRPLASPNNGYSYLNAGSTLSLVYALASKWLQIPPDDPFFQQAKSYLGTVRSVGSTTSSTNEYWQLDSLMNLAPAEQRKSTPRLSEEMQEP